MKSVHIVIDGKSELYGYRCTGCNRDYATWPVYYPGKRQCKYCPDCGHKFKEPELNTPEEIKYKAEKQTRRSSLSPIGGGSRG